MAGELRELDIRSRDVLASVIGAYIRSAVPVSSRQLTRTAAFGLSAASLRNAMADLEDLGFLTHPHVSAGRVPTDLGYRTYVTGLMTKSEPTPEERARIAHDLEPEAFEVDRFLHATSRLLSRLTGEVGVVAAAEPLALVLESVHFTRVAERKVLAIQVSEPGIAESRVLETREDFSQEDLDAISRRLTIDFRGKSLQEIRRHFLDSLEEEKMRFDAALARTRELGRKAFLEARPEPDLYLDGTENFLDKPEFAQDMEALRRMFRALDEKVRLLSLLNDCLEGAPGVRTVIGCESAFTEETRSAVVSIPYGRGDRVLGVLGVVGPRRMEYARIVPLVEELGRYVTRRLTEGTT